MSKPRKSSTTPQSIRIIGGSWRGRLLSVSQNESVRPTPNRVRETLFNWLQFTIEGSDCLDLFAGSGALGFEAASRGAAKVIMIDHDATTISELNKQAEVLQADNITPVCADGMTYLNNPTSKFDIVFLDPPFYKFDLEHILQEIANQSILKANAVIYVETPKGELPKQLPQDWTWRRQSKAGQVEYGLIATQ